MSEYSLYQAIESSVSSDSVSSVSQSSSICVYQSSVSSGTASAIAQAGILVMSITADKITESLFRFFIGQLLFFMQSYQ